MNRHNSQDLPDEIELAGRLDRRAFEDYLDHYSNCKYKVTHCFEYSSSCFFLHEVLSRILV